MTPLMQLLALEDKLEDLTEEQGFSPSVRQTMSIRRRILIKFRILKKDSKKENFK